METASLVLLELIESLARLLHAESRQRGLPHQLQPVHLRALAYLKQANRYSNNPGALAEYLGATKGTVSQSLLLLYRRGLIRRQADARDRRMVRLSLTPKGEEVLSESGFFRDWANAIDGLDPPAVETAIAVLQQALTLLQRQRSGKSFGVCGSCRFFTTEAGGTHRCGLTSEPLLAEDAIKICREHEAAS